MKNDTFGSDGDYIPFRGIVSEMPQNVQYRIKTFREEVLCQQINAFIPLEVPECQKDVIVFLNGLFWLRLGYRINPIVQNLDHITNAGYQDFFHHNYGKVIMGKDHIRPTDQIKFVNQERTMKYL